jgi:hypothetical protein
MRNLDDFDLRPGDPSSRHRSPAQPGGPPAQRSSLSGDIDSRASDAGPGGRAKEPDLDRYAAGPAFDEAMAEEAAAESVAVAPPPRPTYRDRAATAARNSSRAAGLMITLAIAAALVIGFWVMSRRVEPPAPGTVSNEEPSATAPDAAGDEPGRTTELEAPLPPLDESDALVRDLVGALSSNPALTSWLGNPGLIRIFAASVENVSLGQTPAANLPFLRPSGAYRAIERSGVQGNELVPDPATYTRYDLAASVFTSIDPQAAADVYRRLHGLIQEAYADLGYPDQSVDTALAAAFETLLQTPIPATAPALARHLNTFHYVDPTLESLAPSQKQLLRMGPENAARVQDQIRRLASAMNLPVD